MACKFAASKLVKIVKMQNGKLTTTVKRNFVTSIFRQPAVFSSIKKIYYKANAQPYNKAIPVGVAFLRHQVKTTQ